MYMLDFYWEHTKGVDRIPPLQTSGVQLAEYQIYNCNIQHAGAIFVVLVTAERVSSVLGVTCLKIERDSDIMSISFTLRGNKATKEDCITPTCM